MNAQDISLDTDIVGVQGFLNATDTN